MVLFYSAITETMQWAHPQMQGNLPPLWRVHSTTRVGGNIVIIGGGEDPSYCNNVYAFAFDIPTRLWLRMTFTTTDVPPPRHTHTTVFYQNKIRVFGWRKQAAGAERRLDVRLQWPAR